ncbi:Type IV secretion-system coupling protein DNA-binding domain-containing protein [Mucilaginibacter gossypiicola]|uniref:Type IV secretion-system coupling protein DNA-binding domain-containing protein n=1 Tax=Mucilaginibacter gossypiicola TaxID=551995 RepID=A0A1H8AZA3_9SPHI|nr:MULTISPECIES: type IV secretory system conjugative DNA transfer family protein [Mucilaginibacter]UOE52217.1 type IV secretion system DNA-binding domain-containing protein [Mucilaginibacter sp. SMC90]SEM75234.1 Type IV secretion-system coupling protein DNA-binding domain-containing protein [Mucilaginibacter gossypiicola]
MEETREQQRLHGFLQCLIYVSIALEFCVFVYPQAPFWGILAHALDKISQIPIYQQLLYSKLSTLLLICLVSVGTLAKKQTDLNPKSQILYPLAIGLLLFFGSTICYNRDSADAFGHTSWFNLIYMAASLTGAIMISLSCDNISKFIRTGLGKDKWNVEGESFMQPLKPVETPYSVNIPMQFYYNKKVHNGYIPIANPFKGVLLIGVPGSGKSFGIVCPYLRQIIAKEFCVCLYDYKYPDLGKVAYYHYLLAKQHGKCLKHSFHVINLTDPERSRRINPWRSDYLQSLADASESAEGLVEAMKKGDKSGGSDQFFTQSAINFLSACIYFFSKHQTGKFSSLPHVLSFLNHSYEDIFNTLFSEPELVSLLSPFKSAFMAKAFDQLEGQVGTLKIFISRLATKETFWVFSGDDFNLKISEPETPGMLVIANDPNTQNINSACYSVVINRLTKLLNNKGNLPSALVIDEIPTLYTHRIENILAVARSNKVAILMGLQELPQFNQQYGKETAATITSVVGNVLAGAVRNKETLDWLERLFGKSKQIGESLSIDRNKTSTSLQEKLEALIPAGKMASLNTGEMVGLLAADVQQTYTGQFETSAINCRVNLNAEEIALEEKNYRDLPVYYHFGDKKDEILRQNFNRINSETEAIVKQFRQKSAPPATAPEKETQSVIQKK